MMDIFNNNKPFVLVLTVLSLIAMLSACARPESMLVRKGNAPNQVDKDVAFRTTYYFRVFDYCVNKKRVNEHFEDMDNQTTADAGFTKLDNRTYTILNDSLYRFNMTGKASTLLNKIKFESGTLSAAEVDPFGSQIIYDEDIRRFRYSSSQELKQMANAIADEKAHQRKLDRQKKERKIYETEMLNLQKMLNDEEINKPENADIKKLYEELLRDLKTARAKTFQQVASDSRSSPTTTVQQTDTTPEGITSTTTVVSTTDNTLAKNYLSELKKINADDTLNNEEKLALKKSLTKTYESAFATRLSPESNTISCPADAPIRKGFQILGPEGWKTFDQDERLIMAMYSSADPLISVMKDLSNRVLAARSAKQATELPFIEEKNRILKAQQALNESNSSSEINILIEEIKKSLNATES